MRASRCDWVKAQKASDGTNPYPHKFEVTSPTQRWHRALLRACCSARAALRKLNLRCDAQVSISLPEFRKKYEGLPEGAHDESGGLISVAGRIWSKRASGASLIFYDLRGDGAKIQVDLPTGRCVFGG